MNLFFFCEAVNFFRKTPKNIFSLLHFESIVTQSKNSMIFFRRHHQRRKSRPKHRPRRNWLPKLPHNPRDKLHLQRSALQGLLRRPQNPMPNVALLRPKRREGGLPLSQWNSFLTSRFDMRLVRHSISLTSWKIVLSFANLQVVQRQVLKHSAAVRTKRATLQVHSTLPT